MRLLLIAAALALLSGCATYADRQAGAPGFVGQSQKTPDAFVGCAYPKLFNQVSLFNRLSLVPDGEARVMTIADAFGTTVFASITAAPAPAGGSAVAFRGMAAESGWQHIKACL